MYPNHASCPPSGRSLSPPTVPRPGSETPASRAPERRSCTLISLSACLVQLATSTGRGSSAPSKMAYPRSTASGSSAIRSRQPARSATDTGSATAIRPRGAPRSVNTYMSPSRPAHTEVCASTSSCTTCRFGDEGSEADRSASHRSLRGAVPRDADRKSQRPSRLTEAW